jgi:hypothetical protein
MMAANRRKEKSMLDGFLALFAAAYFHRQKIYSIRNERGLRNHLLYYNCSVVPLYTKISYLSCSKTKLNAKKNYILFAVFSLFILFLCTYIQVGTCRVSSAWLLIFHFFPSFNFFLCFLMHSALTLFNSHGLKTFFFSCCKTFKIFLSSRIKKTKAKFWVESGGGGEGATKSFLHNQQNTFNRQK